MVQRSPTYITTMPRVFSWPLSFFFGLVHLIFGSRIMLAFNRWAQIRFEWLFHGFCLACPSVAKMLLWILAKSWLGDQVR